MNGKETNSSGRCRQESQDKEIGATPVTFHDMTTIALVAIKSSTNESTDLEPLAIVITDEMRVYEKGAYAKIYW